LIHPDLAIDSPAGRRKSRNGGEYRCVRYEIRIMVRVRKLEGESPCGEHTRTWEDNIKIYI
jgi:hypothetical protein